MKRANSDVTHHRPWKQGLLARSIIAATGVLLLFLMSRAVPSEFLGVGSLLIVIAMGAAIFAEERQWRRRAEDDRDRTKR